MFKNIKELFKLKESIKEKKLELNSLNNDIEINSGFHGNENRLQN